jgi:H+/Cl- antiporter ClcA
MYKGLSVAFIVVGVMLIIWGVSAYESFDSDVSRFFSGNPTDKSMYLLIGGAVLGIVGVFGLFKSPKK